MFKNKKKHILFIILSILILLPFLSPDRNFNHDEIFHILRIEGLAQNLLNKNFISGVSQNYLFGYGYGVGLFYSNLFLYLPALFLLLGFSSDIVYITFLFFINISTLYSVYFCINNILKNNKFSVLLSILYLIMPYRLINLYLRGAIGELLGLIFIPFVILGIYEIFYGNKDKYYFLVIGMLGLLHSHLISLTIMSFLIFIFYIINIKNKNFKVNIFILIKSAILTILLGSHFLFSMIEQFLDNNFYFSTNKVFLDKVIINILNINDIFKLILNILIILFLIYLVSKNKNYKINKLLLPIWISTIYSSLLMTDIIPLKILSPIIDIIQFPYRLLILYTIILFITLIYFIKNIDKYNLDDLISKNYRTLFFSLFFILFLLNCLLLISKVFIRNNYLFLILIFLHSIFCIIISLIFFNKKIDCKYKLLNSFLNILITISLIFSIFLSSLYINTSYINKNSYLKDNEIYYSYNHSYKIIGSEYLPININIDTIVNNKINDSIKYYDNYSIFKFENKNNNTWLEIPKIYYKGYKTYINNKEVEHRESNNKFIEVNIENIHNGTLTVIYKGTTFSYICLLINWISILYFLYKLYKSRVFNLN